VSGPSKLLKLAQDDFPTYLRLILSILPKASDININVRRMSDEELYSKMESILTHEVLVKLGYVPVGGAKQALPAPSEIERHPIEEMEHIVLEAGAARLQEEQPADRLAQ
jgi:hypothetical protein